MVVSMVKNCVETNLIHRSPIKAEILRDDSGRNTLRTIGKTGKVSQRTFVDNNKIV